MSDPVAPRRGDEIDIEPADAGTRSDGAGSPPIDKPDGGGSAISGPAPAGGRDDRTPESPSTDAQATTAGGGYGVALERPSSGGSGDGGQTAGDDPQSDWLRQTPD